MTDIAEGDSWYLQPGPESDVVLSTRIRVARNLADFPFPEFQKGDDAQRVETLVFDAFSQMEDADDWQLLSVSSMDKLGRQLLAERSILPTDIIDSGTGSVAVRTDGRMSCTVNRHDHVHLAAVMPGFVPSECLEKVRSADALLQKNLSFAGNKEFGYLTSRLKDTGTGMKVSCLLHLPSIHELELQDTLFRSLVDSGFDVYACFAPAGSEITSLGAWYRISTNHSFPLSETDQLAAITSAGRNIIEIERKARQDILLTKPTVVRDRVYRALAAVKFSKFISLREGVELISALKWGVDLGLLDGVSDCQLYSLLVRIQGGHLTFALRSGDFGFEKDVTSPEQKIARLRALIMQEDILPLEPVL